MDFSQNGKKYLAAIIGAFALTFSGGTLAGWVYRMFFAKTA